MIPPEILQLDPPAKFFELGEPRAALLEQPLRSAFRRYVPLMAMASLASLFALVVLSGRQLLRVDDWWVVFVIAAAPFAIGSLLVFAFPRRPPEAFVLCSNGLALRRDQTWQVVCWNEVSRYVLSASPHLLLKDGQALQLHQLALSKRFYETIADTLKASGIEVEGCLPEVVDAEPAEPRWFGHDICWGLAAFFMAILVPFLGDVKFSFPLGNWGLCGYGAILGFIMLRAGLRGWRESRAASK